MRSQYVWTVALAATLTGTFGQAAWAQEMERSTEAILIPVAETVIPPGPTRMWSVNSGNTLPVGTTILDMSLTLGAAGAGPVFSGAPGVAVGIFGTGLNVRADAAVDPGFEVGAGIGVAATVPWRGRLDLHGKWNVMREGVGANLVTLGTMAGGLLEIDANGTPNLGVQLGVTISKVFPFTGIQYAAFTLQPNWNLGISGRTPGLTSLGGFNYLGLGLGLDLALTEKSHFLADTNLGLKVGGLASDSALGMRYAFNRNVMGQIYLGVGGTTGLGIGGIWRM